ncbi:MAG: DUF433 domain-containing protein [Chloroflexota bacterium]
MARYPLNLPADLHQEAARLADKQGVSLNQFILWSVAEKVGELRRTLDDPAFPGITYRVGAARVPTPVIRGTGIRVQTFVVAARTWGMSVSEIAEEWGRSEREVTEALAFYAAHRAEIDAAIHAEEQIEIEHIGRDPLIVARDRQLRASDERPSDGRSADVSAAVRDDA